MAKPVDTDVFVIGGGPAGLATAIAARQQGLRACVADCGIPPLDKSCGEGLMPLGVAALRDLGVDIGPRDGMPFRGIRFIDHDLSAQADLPSDSGLGVRRTTLHKLLVDRARELHVEMHWGARVQCGEAGKVHANGDRVHARWIVGADGQNSRVRKWAGLNAKYEGSPRYGFRRHFRVEPWSEHVEVHWNSASEVYVTPTGPRDVCVAVLTRNPRLRIAKALESFPAIADRLKGADTTSSERGGACISRSLEDVSRGNVLLVGDASGTVDAITGDGISLAMQQAVSMAKALANENPEHYRKEHRRIVGLPMMMSRLMLMLAERGWMRRRAITRLSNHPKLFLKLVAVHVGESGLIHFSIGRMPEFFRKLLSTHKPSVPPSSTNLAESEIEPQ